jgi:dihydroneopterin aldolase / 2-amino-4-hydroxy-6-hydroxymethyldihydropteridine diphosphokinase / dihydropteroate synthase
MAIALGSNLGDAFRNIEHALRLLEDPLRFSDLVFVNVIDTSFLYESKPMYVEDQP